ncbi:polymeric immunoglobulin receptor-like isoform X2 [Brachyhypopomus gauderio]|uniref:polymeric immunoglobulin receptor-like isoform X2 n=1 Tax=Brachyhypopomus gauderio TaxID=698409 RepID=UPI0040414D5C
MLVCVFLLYCGLQVTAACETQGLRECKSGQCIPSRFHCDGDIDCEDGSDEENCLQLTCKARGLLECKSGQCILSSFHCDGDIDCEDGSDEENCTQLSCTRLHPRMISRSPGESVLLLCTCTLELDTSARRVTWSHIKLNLFGEDTVVTVSNDTQTFRDRVWVFENTTSRNFSLLISDLTEEDTGLYLCGENINQHIHLIVTGCSLSENKQHVEVSRSAGESVFLSCSCTHLKEDVWSGEFRVEWRSPHHEDLHSTQLSPRYSGRVQMFNEESPGNLSLLISDLTEEDSGLYSCWINHNQHRNFTLAVKGHDHHSRFCVRQELMLSSRSHDLHPPINRHHSQHLSPTQRSQCAIVCCVSFTLFHLLCFNLHCVSHTVPFTVF